MKKFALIVAGGSGKRMDSDIPKQFLEIGGKPILMHTIEKFIGCNEIVVTLPGSEIDLWRELCERHQFNIKHKVVEGGKTRFQSVKNGLQHIPDGSLVAIHDGVRPFISEEIIENSFVKAALKGNAVVSVSPKDSLRKLTSEGSQHVNRNNFRIIQTPQTFLTSQIKKAYTQPEQEIFTDDASVLEELGERINLIEGSYQNIKITTPIDLFFANSYLGL